MQGTDLLTIEKNKTNYLNKDRSVNIREYMDKQQKLEESGLENIDIVDKAKSLGKDDFLKLLVTQLSHQDPTQPVQDQQFIAQMAQFSSLEQMQNISTSVTNMADRQAFGLVGKFVMGIDAETGEMQSGLAEAVLYDESNKPFVRVNGRAVAVKDVKVIGDANLLNPNRSENIPANTAVPSVNKATSAEFSAAGAAENAKEISDMHSDASKSEVQEIKPGRIENGELKHDADDSSEKSNSEKSKMNDSEINKKDQEVKRSAQEPVSYYDDIFDSVSEKFSMSI